MILGLNIIHNSSVSLIDDTGRVIFAASEERFTRYKNDVGFPEQALNHILTTICKPEDISQIVIGESCSATFYSRSFGHFFYLSNLQIKDHTLRRKFKLGTLVFKEVLGKILRPSPFRLSELVRYKLLRMGLNAPVTFFDHHLCHAASAYYSSRFEEALVITLDAEGDQCSGSIYKGDKSKLRCIERFSNEESIGVFYKAIVSCLGFEANSHEGKITGLAAYGNEKTYYNELKKLLFVEKDQYQIKIHSVLAKGTQQLLRLTDFNTLKFCLKYGWKFLWSRPKTWNSFKKSILIDLYRNFIFKDTALKTIAPESFEYRSQLSASAQKVFEEAVLKIISLKLKNQNAKKIALAGGIFANVKLNQKILETFKDYEIFICPAMGDDGLSLGAAYYQWSLLNQRKPQSLVDVYLGFKDFSAQPFKKSNTYDSKIALAQNLALRISQGELVGLFRSTAEFGPRALGNRTILADARSSKTSEHLNQRLKRNDFMPFAPVILEEDYTKVFQPISKEVLHLTPFMTTTVNVKKEWQEKISAVVHVDGTSRPQTVKFDSKNLYALILEEYKKITGVPVLINTSFNRHEEPIVNSISDAILAFENKAVDLLVIEDSFVLDNHPEPKHLDQFLKSTVQPVQPNLQ